MVNNGEDSSGIGRLGERCKFEARCSYMLFVSMESMACLKESEAS